MNVMFKLYFCTGLLSLIVGYALWCKVRVWRLREDLFEIRDELWDAMRDSGHLQHVEHRRLREQLNSLIRMAPIFSLGSLALMMAMRPGLAETSLPELPELSAVRKRVADRIVHYCLDETLSGLVATFVIRAIKSSMPFHRAIESQLIPVFQSKEVADLGRKVAA